MHIALHSEMSPQVWVREVIKASGERAGEVGHLLSMAKLAKRHPDMSTSTWLPADATYRTLDRGGIRLGTTVFVVSSGMISDICPALGTCRAVIDARLQAVLLVPADREAAARGYAEAADVLPRIAVHTMEDFLAINIIELSDGERQEFIGVMRDIVNEYNRRIEEVETDKSLRIDLD